MVPYPRERTGLRPVATIEVGETGGFLVDAAAAGLTGRRLVTVVGLIGRWFVVVVGLTKRRFAAACCGSEGSTMAACCESAGSRRGSRAGAPAPDGDVVCLSASLFVTGISLSGSADARGSATASLRDNRRGSVGALC
jgi:hypothetical protein